jgi:alcohol dehydrogenase
MGMQQVEGLPELMNMVKKGIIDPKFMLTHHAPLNDILKGYDVFGRKADGCIKWVVTPYER